MAYNTKYILNYCNEKGIPLRIELQLKDYIGEAFILVNETAHLQDEEGRFITVNIDGSYDPDRDKNPIEGGVNPFSLTYRNDAGEKGGTIRATSATMSFYEDAIFNIDDLATSDETDIRCIFFYDDQIEWIGFVTPDFFNVEITDNPIINLTASDRLGILKDVDYVVEDFVSEARVQYIEIISKCLANTGLELNINVVCDFMCQEFREHHDYSYHPFYDAVVSELRFITEEESEETLDCYTIIKKICDQFNCLITQAKGEWWIVNKEQLEIGYGKVILFDHLGEFVEEFPFTQEENVINLIDVGGERSIIPTGAKNTLLVDHGESIKYPKNRTFKGNNESIRNWNKRLPSDINLVLKQVPEEYNSDGNLIKWYTDSRSWLQVRQSEFRPGDDGDPNRAVSQIMDQGAYVLESDKFKIPTLDNKKLSFDLIVKAVGKPETAVSIMLILEFADSTYKYAQLARLTDEENKLTGEIYFRFATGPGDTAPYDNISTGMNFNIMNFIFDNKYKNKNIAVEQEFKLSIDAAQGINQTGLDLSTAKIFVRIYPTFSYGNGSPYLVECATIKEITLDFKSDDQTPKGTIFQSRVEGDYTKPTEQRDLLFGDYITEGQNGFFYRYRDDSYSIHYGEGGSMLKNWNTPRDPEMQPLGIHVLRQITRSYARRHDELRIGFDIDRIDPFCKYAIKCFSDKKVVVESDDKLLKDTNGQQIMVNTSKYLNSKRFILVEGTIDYLRSHFEGVLAQAINLDVENEEYIYSYFDNKDIS